MITDNEIESAGYTLYFNFDDYFTAVLPMTFGKGRIIVAENTLYIDNAWCYSSMPRAIIALSMWLPSSHKEPVGWIRNPMDGRRRSNGDPSKEYFRR